MLIWSLGILFHEIMMRRRCKFFHSLHKELKSPIFRLIPKRAFDWHNFVYQHVITFYQNDRKFQQECKRKELPKLINWKLKPILVHIRLEDWKYLTKFKIYDTLDLLKKYYNSETVPIEKILDVSVLVLG